MTDIANDIRLGIGAKILIEENRIFVGSNGKADLGCRE